LSIHALVELGWSVFPADEAIARWIARARPLAASILRDPVHAHWYRYGGMWFAGVNVMPNDARGSLPDGPPLGGVTINAIRSMAPAFTAWDRGQLSVCFPGYPQPMDGESEAAFRFRVQRDAAHLDGLHHEGPAKRRFVRELHAFILGIPLDTMEEGMSPFVVWEGSHAIMQRALGAALDGVLPDQWGEVDVTAAYQAARRDAFEQCRRVEVVTSPGEIYAVHRLALHGMAPWSAPPNAPARRAIVYFRPLVDSIGSWLAVL
jgi:hypothetical protein